MGLDLGRERCLRGRAGSDWGTGHLSDVTYRSGTRGGRGTSASGGDEGHY